MDEARGEAINERKAQSRVHEERVARVLDGGRVPGSGCLGEVGDVRSPLLLVSCKRVDQRHVVIDLGWIEEICRDAAMEGLTPALALELPQLSDGVERDWVAIPLRVLAALTRAMNKVEKRKRKDEDDDEE